MIQSPLRQLSWVITNTNRQSVNAEKNPFVWLVSQRVPWLTWRHPRGIGAEMMWEGFWSSPLTLGPVLTPLGQSLEPHTGGLGTSPSKQGSLTPLTVWSVLMMLHNALGCLVECFSLTGLFRCKGHSRCSVGMEKGSDSGRSGWFSTLDITNRGETPPPRKCLKDCREGVR